MSLLELHQVSKTYGTGANEVHAVADIELECAHLVWPHF